MLDLRVQTFFTKTAAILAWTWPPRGNSKNFRDGYPRYMFEFYPTDIEFSFKPLSGRIVTALYYLVSNICPYLHIYSDWSVSYLYHI